MRSQHLEDHQYTLPCGRDHLHSVSVSSPRSHVHRFRSGGVGGCSRAVSGYSGTNTFTHIYTHTQITQSILPNNLGILIQRQCKHSKVHMTCSSRTAQSSLHRRTCVRDASGAKMYLSHGSAARTPTNRTEHRAEGRVRRIFSLQLINSTPELALAFSTKIDLPNFSRIICLFLVFFGIVLNNHDFECKLCDTLAGGAVTHGQSHAIT